MNIIFPSVLFTEKEADVFAFSFESGSFESLFKMPDGSCVVITYYPDNYPMLGFSTTTDPLKEGLAILKIAVQEGICSLVRWPADWISYLPTSNSDLEDILSPHFHFSPAWGLDSK